MSIEGCSLSLDLSVRLYSLANMHANSHIKHFSPDCSASSGSPDTLGSSSLSTVSSISLSRLAATALATGVAPFKAV